MFTTEDINHTIFTLYQRKGPTLGSQLKNTHTQRNVKITNGTTLERTGVPTQFGVSPEQKPIKNGAKDPIR